MRTETPVVQKLSDYAPYPFEIVSVSIDFDLAPHATRVQAELTIRPLANGPMFLHGETLALKSIRIDAHGALSPQLDAAAYELSEAGLTLTSPPQCEFRLETIVEISPETNTALSGLYMSGGRFCSQCEAEGFRRITFYPDRPDVMSRFEVRIAASKADCPVLLSNGTPGEAGELGAGRHFASWSDPHKKPAYLFALCAGAYDVLRDTFTTISGRKVGLAIHVDEGEAPRAAWAMQSLKRSMKWDEDVYGREYDLGVFNIVAVRDFNFGAMENKGLNVFNSAYVLADEMTAADADFEAIESIVAHEYFHNWTGNRITCRDWFQLCLKEGLTVFRDQCFSADMRSAPVQRIKDVIRLRARQFPEDAGPLAHPVRPDTFAAIDNLYTATVYEKGAELIRMLKRLIGDKDFYAGMQLYFERHDGQAVTIEDFYACFEAASGMDLAAFRRWYAEPGTPSVEATSDWSAETGTLRLRLSQSVPGRNAPPKTIPLSVALIDRQTGARLVEQTCVVDGASGQWEFKGLNARPYVSLNRDFSAPVSLCETGGAADLTDALTHEDDPFRLWDHIQMFYRTVLLDGSEPPAKALDAIAARVRQSAPNDPTYAALLVRLPDTVELMSLRTPADPARLEAARKKFQTALYQVLAKDIAPVLSEPSPAPYRPDAGQCGVRALKSAFLLLLGASPHRDGPHALLSLYENAPNMTERLAALRVLAGSKGGPRVEALEHFETVWKHNPLVMDKWFAAQAATGTAQTIASLAAHPDFDLRNPNRVRAVAAVFAAQNPAAFHAPDGSGYRAIEDLILKVDQANPALGARLLAAFEPWSTLEPMARAEAKACLERLQSAGLSPNSADIVRRALGATADA